MIDMLQCELPSTIDSALSRIERALANHQYETARRLCLDTLTATKHDGTIYAVSLLLHNAYKALGDLTNAIAVLNQIIPPTEDDHFTLLLLQAEDYASASTESYYRGSAESKAGLTVDEFASLRQAKASDYFAQAEALATSDDHRQRLATMLRRCKRSELAEKILPTPVLPSDDTPCNIEFGTLTGKLSTLTGEPISDVIVTLGLAVEVQHTDPQTVWVHELGYHPKIGEQETRQTTTDAQGCFSFDRVPAGRQEYLAVTLDPQRYNIATHFLQHGVEIVANQETQVSLTLREWESAPAYQITVELPETVEYQGRMYQRVLRQQLHNPFVYDFPRQLLRLPLPDDSVIDNVPSSGLLLNSGQGITSPQDFQIIEQEVVFLAELQACSDCEYAFYITANTLPTTSAPQAISFMVDPDGRTAVIGTSRAQFRIPYGDGADNLPPLCAVRGEDGIWRGNGRLCLPTGVQIERRYTEIVTTGPILLTVRINYHLSTGQDYHIELTLHRDEAYLLVHEVCPDCEGFAFEFSLREFMGGRGFLHWNAESNGSRHWRSLEAEPCELARLQESVVWWAPNQGFGYAMTADGLADQDYIGVFTVQRGEWIDRKFAELAQGPGDDQRELDWPYPEMVGSTISMITANTDATGDAFFRFAAFDGERRWGLLASSLTRNDGRVKELSLVQHKNSSPRLQEFKDWQLDHQDTICRPYVMVQRESLRDLRLKAKSPLFKPYWDKICDDGRPGAAQGLRFIISGDPTVAWRKKLELVEVAQMYSRLTLLGRDYSDIYSPVGARPLTNWATEYDLIAASGVFTPEEERTVRAFLMLMGHMYMNADLMNWHYNARNANFEADRLDVVGAVGLAFHGNPDADTLLCHVVDCFTRVLEVYCTPGSGKWYENPACYYLHSAKCRCNLAFLLATHDIFDVTTVPRFKDFLRWGIYLLTPPMPHDYTAVCHQMTDEQYHCGKLVRRVPPIGDHAHIGPWVPEHYAFMSKLYRATDPDFADELLWAYIVGGSDGGYHGNISLLFTGLDDEDFALSQQHTPDSRRLEGFGAVLRNHVNTEHEEYILFKQGPGGYRFHRTEGSLLYFAHGKPLLYDGGEAGETWRHSTLSFYETHAPLAAGHVEQFTTFPSVDFVQGVHPEALKPGEPVFLSDSCEHTLVPVAYERYNEPDPANVRSLLWVKDSYLVMHDDLHLDANIPCYWHLQVVADQETTLGPSHWRFQGRYGTDLQVLLPDQPPVETQIETLPILEYHLKAEDSFAMRHLQIRSEHPTQYLAVLRPLSAQDMPISAELIQQDNQNLGVIVTGDGIDDTIFLSRDPVQYSKNGIHLNGRYAAILRREHSTELLLLQGQYLSADGISLESDGTAVRLRYTKKDVTLTAYAAGQVTLTGFDQPFEMSLAAGQTVQFSR